VRRSWTRAVLAGLLTLQSGAGVGASEPSVRLLGVGRVAGTQVDRSGLGGRLETETPTDQFGGLSALDYTGTGNRFLGLSDRGPGDGAAGYPCRYHELELTLDVDRGAIDCRIVATHLFSNARGEQLVGSLTALAADQAAGLHGEPGAWTALDPEGLRRLPGGELLISDEYGPHLAVFSADGKLQREYLLPERFRLAAGPDYAHRTGVYPNRGLEGVSSSPDGRWIVAAMQGALIEDGRVEKEKCLGINTRWILLDSDNRKSVEVVYQLDSESSGVSEVLWLDARRVLVLERDSRGGVEAQIKRVYLADWSEATNVSHLASLPPDGLPPGVKAARKQLLIDLLDPRFGLGGELAAEKPEGLCWGPQFADGSRTLWLCVDNDFDEAKDSQFYAFQVSGLGDL
jgi:hypothetical protein